MNNVDFTDEEITCISLFTGGGFLDTGLRRVIPNLRMLAYVEIEAFAVERLASQIEAGYMDEAPIFTDVTSFPAEAFRGKVHLVIAGYPCQDFSCAGNREGLEGKRGKMWGFTRAVVSGVGAHAFFGENVDGHVSLGLDTVVSDLAEDGFMVKAGIYSAAEVGAPHRRNRVFSLSFRADPRLSPWDKCLKGGQGWPEGVAHSLHLGYERSRRPESAGTPTPASGCGEWSRGEPQHKSGGCSESTGASVADSINNGNREGHGEASDQGRGGSEGRGEGLHEGREAHPADLGVGSENPSSDTTGNVAHDPCSGYAGGDGSRHPGELIQCDSREERSEGRSESGGGGNGYARGRHATLPVRWPARPGFPQHGWEPPRVIPPVPFMEYTEGNGCLPLDDEHEVSSGAEGEHTMRPSSEPEQSGEAESGLGGDPDGATPEMDMDEHSCVSGGGDGKREGGDVERNPLDPLILAIANGDKELARNIQERKTETQMREHRLRMLGNGVVWLTAAKAFSELIEWHCEHVEDLYRLEEL